MHVLYVFKKTIILTYDEQEYARFLFYSASFIHLLFLPFFFTLQSNAFKIV